MSEIVHDEGRIGETRRPEGAASLRLAVAPLRDVHVRAVGETGGEWNVIEGYAAVFEQATVLFDSAWFRMREVISRGAFDGVLAREPLVHLNHGHDMQSAIASTKVEGIGSLELEADFHGLRYHARVDPTDPDVQRLGPKMQRGIVSQASFAFTIEQEVLEAFSQDEASGKWDELWRIETVGDLFDVCVCAQGAYSQTESVMRSLATALDGRVAARAPRRSGMDATEGANVVAEAPATVGDPSGPAASSAAALLKLRARTRLSTSRKG